MANYVVYKTYNKTDPFAMIRWDEPDGPQTKIGRFASKASAIKSARLLAGWRGKVAYTTDITTYPF